MDRTAKIQVCFIAIGLFLIVSSVYVAYSYFLLFAFCSVGVAFVLTGYSLRARLKIYEKSKEQFERRKGSPKSDADVVGIIALIFVFTSLGFGVFSAYVVNVPTLNVLFFVLLAIGLLVGLVSSAFRSAERKKQKNERYNQGTNF